MKEISLEEALEYLRKGYETRKKKREKAKKEEYERETHFWDHEGENFSSAGHLYNIIKPLINKDSCDRCVFKKKGNCRIFGELEENIYWQSVRHELCKEILY